jgi:uncharacterized Zn finger protein (UPF0148 family)
VSEKVTCPICGVQKQNLGWHIRSAHNLTKAEFKVLYPDTFLISKKARKRMSVAAKTQWKDNYFEKKSSIHSIQARQKGKENRGKNALTMQARFKKGRVLYDV